MPLRVFPVATTDAGAPTYTDDFGGKRSHNGIDIFAAEGTPVLAPDDGTVTLTTDGKRGGPGCPPPLSFHLQSVDAFYYGTHLSAWPAGKNVEDSWDVQAGDVVGYVGHGGNACHTAAHLHFEKHVGGVAIDPYADLRAAQGLSAPPAPAPGPAPEPTPRGFTMTLAAKALVAAYRDKHGEDPPSPATLSFPMSQVISEGSFASTFLGSNNFGSMHATKPFEELHKDDPGFGVLAHLESGAGGFYIGPFRIHPSAQIGARAFLDLVEGILSRAGTSLADIGDELAYARALYIAGYFVGAHVANVTPLAARVEAFAAGLETFDDDDNVSDYAAAIRTHLGEANAAIANIPTDPRDPSAVSVGPPFGDVAERLTAGRPPHTLAHAKELLGANADHPPGGALSLGEVLAAPDGPGVWMFGPHHAPPPISPSPAPATSSAPRTSSGAAEVLLAIAAVSAGGLAIATIANAPPTRQRARA